MGKEVKFYWREEAWYPSLSSKAKCIADLIYKSHDYFSKKDARYRRIVQVCKIIVLILAMASTIIFGLKTIIDEDIQVIVGLIVSALITFVTALSSYFNYEVYWIRNIKTHIKLNMLRDRFRLDAEGEALDDEKLEYYMNELQDIQKENLIYWERNINK